MTRKGVRGTVNTVEQTIEELHSNGEDAISLDEETLQYAKDENDYLFVDFYASWCNHCQDLAPTWEALAELMLDASERLGNQHPNEVTSEDYAEAEKVQVPVMIAKIDCVIHHALCTQNEIRAYPTLRLFVDGQKWKGGDYRGHRTLLHMVEWLYLVEMEHTEEKMDDRERNLHAAHAGTPNLFETMRRFRAAKPGRVCLAVFPSLLICWLLRFPFSFNMCTSRS